MHDQTRLPQGLARCSPEAFGNLVASIDPYELDAWWNRVLALDEIPQDSDDLPRGCVPYMPAPIDVLRRVVAWAPVTARDVFVDVGCGLGRAALFVRLLSGARVVGLDVQSHLVTQALVCAERLGLGDVTFLLADACEQGVPGSVYFLYCPFGAERVKAFLNVLRPLGNTKSLTIACLDIELPTCDWLVRTHEWPDLRLYRSVSKHPGHVRSMKSIPDP